MTRRATFTPAKAMRIDWVASLGRMEVGDKLLLHDVSQQQCGAMCAKHSKDGKRYVSKKHPEAGVYVIRTV
jgi:hypothetical protein